MPELPEVETIKNGLMRRVLGKRIVSVEVVDKRVIKEPGRRKFAARLIRRTFTDIIRRGKALIFSLDDGTCLIVHLRIAGWLTYGVKDPAARVAFCFRDGNCLNYLDQRALGEIRHRKDYRSLPFLKSLGPEPLAMSLEVFTKIVQPRKAAIKNLLLNQKALAGVGNIYAQEALFASKINPLRKANTLRAHEVKLLHANLIAILQQAICCKGSSVNLYRDVAGKKGSMAERLQVYGRQGLPCFACKKPIEKIFIGARGTCFCPQCQK